MKEWCYMSKILHIKDITCQSVVATIMFLKISMWAIGWRVCKRFLHVWFMSLDERITHKRIVRTNHVQTFMWAIGEHVCKCSSHVGCTPFNERITLCIKVSWQQSCLKTFVWAIGWRVCKRSLQTCLMHVIGWKNYVSKHRRGKPCSNICVSNWVACV